MTDDIPYGAFVHTKKGIGMVEHRLNFARYCVKFGSDDPCRYYRNLRPVTPEEYEKSDLREVGGLVFDRGRWRPA